jgi:hypothetical protein
VPTLGFLHTAEVHVETFDALVAHAAPDVDVVHLVAPDLLADARALGPDDPLVVDATRDALADLERQEPDVVVCTCSTISGVAELLETPDGPDIVRIDRPLATNIVTTAGKAALVATVESTLAPTLAVFEEERAARAGDTELVVVMCQRAWPHFEAGRIEQYLESIAHEVDALDDTYDAVVLAQASMAAARDLVAKPERVHSSPVPALEAALELL